MGYPISTNQWARILKNVPSISYDFKMGLIKRIKHIIKHKCLLNIPEDA